MTRSDPPPRPQRVRQVFEEAAGLQGEDRTAYLDRACHEDPSLRAEVETLLRAAERADSTLGPFEEGMPQPDTAAVTSPDPYALIGRHVSHYEILEHLGGGGMGVVYKARDKRLDRLVALKFLPLELTQDPEARVRFVHEAKAASALDHPNIATIYEIDETDQVAGHPGLTFIAMACYAGETLKARIARGPLPLGETVDVAIQMAEGLRAAHEAGIVHRDVKPANVMITEAGVVKLIDFGLAKLAGLTTVTKAGTTLGTVAYMSPEQARGEVVDCRTDLWSLGVVIHEMVTGQRPFGGDYEQAVVYAILNQGRDSLLESRPETPPALERVVAHALEKRPDDRPASVAELLEELRALKENLQPSAVLPADREVFLRLLRSPRVAVPGVILLLLIVAISVWRVDVNRKIRWARLEALPEIVRLVEEERYAAAFALATRAERYIPRDSALAALWPRFSGYLILHSEPSGAAAYLKPYQAPDEDWRLLGTTPVDSVRVARDNYWLRLEKAGYYPVEAIPQSRRIEVELDEDGSLPPGMVRVPGGAVPVSLSGLTHLTAETVGDFLIDRHEVTNREFKRFVDDEGYGNRAYWKHPVLRGGRVLPWKEAMALFVDKTGRPGPATWEVGDYPEGEDEFPVTGVSWYEAAAYAEYVGKSLPTIYHWNRAAGISWNVDLSRIIVPQSNFGSRGLAAAGSHQGIGHFGTVDLAGNAREWCFNEVLGTNQRFILGGAWNDPDYMYTCSYSEPALDRSPKNGFRCVKVLTENEPPVHLSQPVSLAYRDYATERPVSDVIFEVFLRQFAYDPIALDAVVEAVDSTADDWTREKISFDAAYGRERMLAYLYLPKNAVAPYQVVLFFPGSNAIDFRSVPPWLSRSFDFILRSGRAVMLPVYRGMFERGDELASWVPDSSNFYKERLILWTKDFARSIDYLESRDDIDSDRLAYYGISLGGFLGGIIPAVEARVRAGVLLTGGLVFQRPLPEVDVINYLPRITIPILMLNGRYDYIFPLETSQKPAFELLGTPDSLKRHVVFESTHTVPREGHVRETLAWLDRYFGPVN